MRITRYAVLGSVLVAVVLTAGCTQTAPPPVETLSKFTTSPAKTIAGDAYAMPPAGSSEARMLAGVSRFSFELLAAEQSRQATAAVSVAPWAAYSGLALTAAGSAGSTRSQLEQALHYDGVTPSEADTAYAAILYRIVARTSPPAFVMPNSMWVDSGVKVSPAFIRRDQDYYGASIGRTNVHDPSITSLVRSWITGITQGHVTSLPSARVPEGAGFLADTVYFADPWLQAFPKENTAARAFTLAGGTRIDVPTMHNIVLAPVEDTDAYLGTAVRTDTGGMLWVFLAKPGKTIQQVMAALAQRKSGQTPPPDVAVDLYLPKFAVNWQGDLVEPLTTLGVQDAFKSGKADLSGIAKGLWLGHVLQGASLSVDENGIDSLTGASGGPRPGPGGARLITVDRPFVFMLERANVPLLAGTVEDPR